MSETQHDPVLIKIIQIMTNGHVLELDKHHQVCRLHDVERDDHGQIIQLSPDKFVLTFSGLDVAAGDWDTWTHPTAASAVAQWKERSSRPTATLKATAAPDGGLLIETRWGSQDEGHGGELWVPFHIYGAAWSRAKRAGNGAGSVLNWLQELAETGRHGVRWTKRAESAEERNVRQHRENQGSAGMFAQELARLKAAA